MSTPPTPPLEVVEFADAFFAEIGVPYALRWDPIAETWSAYAIVGDLDDAPATRGARRTRRPAARRRRR